MRILYVLPLTADLRRNIVWLQMESRHKPLLFGIYSNFVNLRVIHCNRNRSPSSASGRSSPDTAGSQRRKRALMMAFALVRHRRPTPILCRRRGRPSFQRHMLAHIAQMLQKLS